MTTQTATALAPLSIDHAIDHYECCAVQTAGGRFVPFQIINGEALRRAVLRSAAYSGRSAQLLSLRAGGENPVRATRNQATFHVLPPHAPGRVLPATDFLRLSGQ